MLVGPKGGLTVECWRPSSRIVMALGANAQGGGRMLREVRNLHASLRVELEVLQAVQGANYHY